MHIVRVGRYARGMMRRWASTDKPKYVLLEDIMKHGIGIVPAGPTLQVDSTNFLKPPGYEERFAYDLPFDIKGSGKITKFEPKEFIQSILLRQKGEDLDFPEIFNRIYDKFINSLVSRDYAALNRICEKRLAQKTIQALDSLQKRNLKLGIETPNGSRTTHAEVVDYYLNRGLSVNREENGLNVDYVMGTVFEEQGLRYYRHRYFMPEFHLAYLYEMDSSGKFLHYPDGVHEFRHKMIMRDGQMMLKLVAQISDTNRLQVYANQNSSKGLIEYTPSYKGIHTLVFENAMRAPKMTALIELDYVSWLAEHQARRSDWVLVDVDNYLNGNPYFAGIGDFKEFKKAVTPVSAPLEDVVPREKLDQMAQELDKQRGQEKVWLKSKKIHTREQALALFNELTAVEADGQRQEDTSEMSVDALIKKPAPPPPTKKNVTKENVIPTPKVTKKQREKAKEKANAKAEGGPSKKKWKKR